MALIENNFRFLRYHNLNSGKHLWPMKKKPNKKIKTKTKTKQNETKKKKKKTPSCLLK